MSLERIPAHRPVHLADAERTVPLKPASRLTPGGPAAVAVLPPLVVRQGEELELHGLRLAEADPELLLTLANGQQRVSTTVSTLNR